MDTSLTAFMESQLKQTTSAFHRYMFDKISWSSRMFGLVGPRGVGKSTIVLQYIKENRKARKMFYVSADHLYFSSHTLADTADEFVKEGGEQLFIDEIHKYENCRAAMNTHHPLTISNPCPLTMMVCRQG